MLRPRKKRLAVVAARQTELRGRQGRGSRPLFYIGHPRDELQALACPRAACGPLPLNSRLRPPVARWAAHRSRVGEQGCKGNWVQHLAEQLQRKPIVLYWLL